ncbi:MAG TPA: hypothetical protein VG186_13200 [Solirubrobacteraceae bacterium]|nr:hypothetical protein [Solirubrobacteraceae bacterium]
MASTPATTPRTDAGRAMSAASSPWARAMCPRGAPTARRTPIAPSRRWTSARAEAASITLAVTSAMIDSATRRSMTIPAAWSRSTRTPARVANWMLCRPKLVPRAWTRTVFR